MENIFHRYLNLPFDIRKYPLFETTPKQMRHHDITGYIDKNVNKFHQNLGLSIIHTEIFYTPAGQSIPIHADSVTLDNHVKINITFGPNEGKIRWWKSNNTKVVKDRQTAQDMLGLNNNNNFSQRDHTNVLAKAEDCELVWEANTNRPSLVNVGQLHDTYSPPEAGRWTLCFVPGNKGGSDYVYWDEALEIYKDYIVGE